MSEYRETMSPQEFLESFDESQLSSRGVLNQSRNLLNGPSVEPLLELMRECGVRELKTGRWFIDLSGAFCNPNAKDARYRSGVAQLGGAVRDGVVFEGQNNRINPFYGTGSATPSSPLAAAEYDETIFINEVVSSPENRVNLNLFGLLNVSEFRQWFFDRLELPTDAVLFPTKNTAVDDADGRPDYEVLDGEDRFLAYVEVELGGENHEQLSRYRTMAAANAGRVISIVGKREWGGDLSLEEILAAVQGIRNAADRQVTKYCNAYEAMYFEYVLGRSSSRSYPAAEVSNEMREHRFVLALCDHLPVTFDITGPMSPGQFRMNTRKEQGMSLRIYSRESSVQSSLAVASISGGRDRVIFPSKVKLKKYLASAKSAAISDYANVLSAMGHDISPLTERQTARVPLATVMLHVEDLATAIRRLGAV